MTRLHLLIGNKNYSSWSLRAWLALRYYGISFEETVVPLYEEEGYKQTLLDWSPAGQVPVLKDGEVYIWESLAILEHLAERFPDKEMWPASPEKRAHARSISAEMHAGFAALRREQPMNLRRRVPDLEFNDQCRSDIRYIDSMWSNCRRRYADNGPFLFGQFSLADAMYTPVVTRFNTYEIAVSDAAREYMATILALPSFQEWAAAAAVEPWVISRSEL